MPPIPPPIPATPAICINTSIEGAICPSVAAIPPLTPIYFQITIAM